MDKKTDLDFEQIELQAREDQEEKSNEEKISLEEALYRLINNQDFNKIFLVGYLQNETLKYMYDLARTNNSNREEIQEVLMGISRFNQYIEQVFRNGEIARKAKYFKRVEESKSYSSDEEEVL